MTPWTDILVKEFKGHVLREPGYEARCGGGGKQICNGEGKTLTLFKEGIK